MKHLLVTIAICFLAACGGGDDESTAAYPPTNVAEPIPSTPFDPTPRPTEFQFNKRNEWVIIDFNLGGDNQPSMNVVAFYSDEISINGVRVRDASWEDKKTKIRSRYFSVGKNLLEITTKAAKYVGELTFTEADLFFLGMPRRIGDSQTNALAVVAEHPDGVEDLFVSIDGSSPIRSEGRGCFGFGDWFGFICTGEQAFVTEHPGLSSGVHRAVAKMITKTGKVLIGQPFDFLVSHDVTLAVSHCHRAANTNGTGEMNAVTIVGTTTTDRPEPTFVSFFLGDKQIGRIPVTSGFRWFTHTMNLSPPLPNGDYVISAVANNLDGSDISNLPENRSSCLLKLR